MVFSLKRVDEDWEIVEGFQRQDEEVQKRFYLRCLSYYQRHIDALVDFHMKAATREDLFHETFLCLWEELEYHTIRTHGHKVYRLDRTGEERRMTASLLTFFMAVAKNRHMELEREEKWYEPLVSEVKIPAAVEDDDFLMERLVGEGVSRLPQRCRDILTKFYYRGMTLDQILASREENISKDGLKTGKSKCMGMLKADLLKCFKKHNLKINGHEQRNAK